jgi:DNA-binding beta-propeller fold protein YncE
MSFSNDIGPNTLVPTFIFLFTLVISLLSTTSFASLQSVVGNSLHDQTVSQTHSKFKHLINTVKLNYSPTAIAVNPTTNKIYVVNKLSIALKPGHQSDIQSPNLSRMAYKATAPGITNSTMIFKYGVETTASKTPVIDSISRFFAFSIKPGTQHPAATSTTSTSMSTAGPLKLPTP